MKSKAKIIIAVLSVLLLVSVIYNIYNLEISSEISNNTIVWKECVPNEEAAIGIAKVIYKVYTGEELNNDDFSCAEGENEWQVHLKNAGDFDENISVSDDSGVYINKSVGTIRKVLIRKNDMEDYMKLKAEYE